MSEKLEQLKTLLAEVADLNAVQALLGWDQQTYMPQGGGEARGNQLATIGKISHQKFTSDEIGKLLADLETGVQTALTLTRTISPAQGHTPRLRPGYPRAV